MRYKNKLPVSGIVRSVYKEVYKEQKLEAASLKIGGGSSLFYDVFLHGDILILEDLSEAEIKDALEEAFLRLTNHIFTNLSIPEGVFIELYGEGVKEKQIGLVMSMMNGLLGKYHLKLMGGDTQLRKESSKQRITISLQILGRKINEFISVKEGQSIYVLGYIGNGTTKELMNEYAQELKSYHQGSIQELLEAFQPRSISKLFPILEKLPISYLKMIGEGGILAGLWSMSNYLKIGYEVFLRKIPVSVLTVCLSEFAGLNPYKLPSIGALIMVGDRDLDLSEIEKIGWISEEVGRLKYTNESKVIHGEEQSFVEKPQYDYGRK